MFKYVIIKGPVNVQITRLPISPYIVLLGDIFESFIFPNNFPIINAEVSLTHVSVRR